MDKIGISEEKLLKEYNVRIDEICDYLEFKTAFTGEEVCDIVIGILEKEKVKTPFTSTTLYRKYSEKINSLGLTREEWVKNYGIPQIIGVIYEILEKKV